MKKKVGICIFVALLLALSNIYAEGLLPSLTETVGIPMPSFGEATSEFPIDETELNDGSSVEHYINVSEDKFNTFNVYLEEKGASIKDYTANNNMLSATILYKNTSFSIQYDVKKAEIFLTYPPHAFDEWLEKYKRDYAEGKEKLNSNEWEAAISAFKNAGAYSDAKQMISQTYYLEGISKLESKDWAGAIEAFEKAGDYSDARTKVQETYYIEGTEKQKVKEWDLAIASFEKAGNYKDAKVQIDECTYQKAIDLVKDKNYDEALELFSSLESYSDSPTRVKECYYHKAMGEYQAKEYELAADHFHTAKDFNNAKDMEKQARKRIIGRTIKLGHYEQDNNKSNGKEPIEWILVDADSNKAVLISKYILDVQQYDSKRDMSNWEKSKLRKWLNTTFLQQAFSKDEQKNIVTATVSNSRNNVFWNKYYENGVNTQDKVFIPCYTEARDFATKGWRPRSTTFSESKSHLNQSLGEFNIWLRTPPSDDEPPEATNSVGSNPFRHSSNSNNGVCPMIWIDIDSSTFD